jgi:hypothetical protein
MPKELYICFTLLKFSNLGCANQMGTITLGKKKLVSDKL